MKTYNRPHSPDLDAVIGVKIPVLDHGSITLIDYMGVEQSVVDAARISYSGGGTVKLNDDKDLLTYLWRNKHSSPFEMLEIRFNVTMPIFVMRQWVRHRAGHSLNEVSARYSQLDSAFYVPENDQLKPQSFSNRQGRAEIELSEEDKQKIEQVMCCNNQDSYERYEQLLNELSLTRELSRCVLPVNIYTSITSKWDLRNLLHFLYLRMDSHAQYEIRVYAEEIYKILSLWCPKIIENFDNYTRFASTFSEEVTDIVRETLLETVTPGAFRNKLIARGIKKREADDNIKALFGVVI